VYCIGFYNVRLYRFKTIEEKEKGDKLKSGTLCFIGQISRLQVHFIAKDAIRGYCYRFLAVLTTFLTNF